MFAFLKKKYIRSVALMLAALLLAALLPLPALAEETQQPAALDISDTILYAQQGIDSTMETGPVTGGSGSYQTAADSADFKDGIASAKVPGGGETTFAYTVPASAPTGTHTYTYTVQDAQNADMAALPVTVTLVVFEAPKLTSFVLKKADNPALSADITGVIGEDTVTLTVPRKTDVKNLRPTLQLSDGAKVAVGFENGTAHDFTGPVLYMLTAADGATTKTYTVVVNIDPTPLKRPQAVTVAGYSGTYDGKAHSVTVSGLVEGDTLSYSTDGGVTWTSTLPTYTAAGSYTTQVKVTNPDYEAVGVLSAKVEIGVSKSIKLDISGLSNITQAIWIDGKEYFGSDITVSGGTYALTLPDTNAKTAVVYAYNSVVETNRNKLYPVNMYVWMLSHDGSGYTATRISEFDNLLQYGGSSIRVSGKKGIRMITGISESVKTALTSAAGLKGYTLEEYGTVVAWSEEVWSGAPLVLGASYAKSNYAYKKGMADPVFARNNGVVQYTNVLVGFDNDQCIQDLAQRSYMKLKTPAGEVITLYGAPVYRSIGYIAKQNSEAFSKGTAAYRYVQGIIDYVNTKAASTDEYSIYPIARNEKLKGKVIILDPGHGKRAGGGYAEYTEHVYNLIHANYIKKALENCGATVIMTRTDDTNVDNFLRVTMANKYTMEVLREIYEKGTAEEKAQVPELTRLIGVMQSILDTPELQETYYLSPYEDTVGRPIHPDLKKIFEYQKDPRLSHIIYISVHSNAPASNNNTSPNGTVTYYMSNKQNEAYYTGYQEADNKELATLLCDRVVRAGGYKKRGVNVNDFFMVREVNIVSALIETGFHTNSGDRAKLMDPAVQKRVANSVAYAVIDYFEN